MVSMSHAFSQKRASVITGLSVRQLEYWDQTDVIKPSIAPYEVRTLPRLYSFRDLLRLRVAKELRQARMLPSEIRRMVDELERRGYDEPLLTLRFVTAVTESGRRAREVVWLDPRTDEARSCRLPGQVAQG
jgi:DNA-binding transcriptional MerR regulator